MTAFCKLPVILDGATGTELQKLGMPAGVCVEKWVLENPGSIKKKQRALWKTARRVYAPTFRPTG
jgi:5-methyltetrahydrofolate--homocysteine methyltransferase